MAIRLNNLAQLLKATKRLDEAEPLAARACAIFRESLGADHPNSEIVCANLASIRAKLAVQKEQAGTVEPEPQTTDHPYGGPTAPPQDSPASDTAKARSPGLLARLFGGRKKG